MTTPTATEKPRTIHTLAIALDHLTSSPENGSGRRKLAIDELAASIKEHGVLEPLLVRPHTTGAPGDYEIVAGDRRATAAKKAGLTHVPCLVRDLTDEQARVIRIVENIQRKDVHPLEEADGYGRLMTEHQLAAAAIAVKVGKPLGHVLARLKLRDLEKPGREAFLAGKFGVEVALMVARLPAQLQKQALDALRAGSASADDPVSVAEGKRVVHEEFMLRLANAPFDRGDATLVPAAGACKDCPKRTGNQRELFADVESPDVCTDPACFADKRDAAWARRAAAHAAKGGEVLDAKIPRYQRAPKGYVGLGEHDYRREKSPTYGSLLEGAIKKGDAKVVLAQDADGKPVELVRAADVVKFAPAPKRSGSSGAGADGRSPRDRAKAKLGPRVLALALEAVAEKAAAKAPDDALWRFVTGAAHLPYADAQRVIARRGGGSIAGIAAKLKGGELRGFAVEVLAARDGFYSFAGGDGLGTAIKRACSLYGVSLARLRSQAVREMKAKKAASKGRGKKVR